MRIHELPKKPPHGEVICRSCGTHSLHWQQGLYMLCEADGSVHVCKPIAGAAITGRRHDDPHQS